VAILEFLGVPSNLYDLIIMIGGAATFFVMVKRYLFGKTIDIVKQLDAKNIEQDKEIKSLNDKLNTVLIEMGRFKGRLEGR
jgi:hypothetical protein